MQQLYFQNPTFGFYLLGLITTRLIGNLEQLEGRLREPVPDTQRDSLSS